MKIWTSVRALLKSKLFWFLLCDLSALLVIGVKKPNLLIALFTSRFFLEFVLSIALPMVLWMFHRGLTSIVGKRLGISDIGEWIIYGMVAPPIIFEISHAVMTYDIDKSNFRVLMGLSIVFSTGAIILLQQTERKLEAARSKE